MSRCRGWPRGPWSRRGLRLVRPVLEQFARRLRASTASPIGIERAQLARQLPRLVIATQRSLWGRLASTRATPS